MYQRIPVRILCDRPSRGGHRIRWPIDMLSCYATNCRRPMSGHRCRSAKKGKEREQATLSTSSSSSLHSRASGSPGSILVRRKMGHSPPPSPARKHKRREGAPKVHSQVKAESDSPIAILIIKVTSKLQLVKVYINTLLVSLKRHRNPRRAMKSSRSR